jgi:hypothetical protein
MTNERTNSATAAPPRLRRRTVRTQRDGLPARSPKDGSLKVDTTPTPRSPFGTAAVCIAALVVSAVPVYVALCAAIGAPLNNPTLAVNFMAFLVLPSAAVAAVVLFPQARFWDMERRRNQIALFLLIAYAILVPLAVGVSRGLDF